MFYLNLHTYNMHALQQEHAQARSGLTRHQLQGLRYPLFTTNLVLAYTQDPPHYDALQSQVAGDQGEAFAELLQAKAPIHCSAAGLTRLMMHSHAHYMHPEPRVLLSGTPARRCTPRLSIFSGGTPTRRRTPRLFLFYGGTPMGRRTPRLFLFYGGTPTGRGDVTVTVTVTEYLFTYTQTVFILWWNSHGETYTVTVTVTVTVYVHP